VTASFTNQWVTYLVGKFGTAANGGVAAYDLDNEPAWWDAVHRDVHPVASTYDEVTNNGIAVAEAVKTADPTAAVSGPVVDYWWNYFYSKKDIENGWGHGNPCYQPWSNPIDREAHGGVPFIEYYLQQFAASNSAQRPAARLSGSAHLLRRGQSGIRAGRRYELADCAAELDSCLLGSDLY
jgi:hypothetical protein